MGQPQAADESRARALAKRRRTRRRVLVWGSGGLALLLAVAVVAGFTMLKHFNANIRQENIAGMLGTQPVNSHPRAENILVIGSDSRNGLSRAFGSGLVISWSGMRGMPI